MAFDEELLEQFDEVIRTGKVNPAHRDGVRKVADNLGNTELVTFIEENGWNAFGNLIQSHSNWLS